MIVVKLTKRFHIIRLILKAKFKSDNLNLHTTVLDILVENVILYRKYG